MAKAPQRPATTPGASPLLGIGPLLQREVDVDELLSAMVASVIEALGAERGTIYLLDPGTGELVSRAAHLPELREIRLRPGQGVAGTVAATGAVINLPAAEDDRRFFKDIDRQTGFRTRSVLAVPLSDREGRIRGVVQVLNARSGRFEIDAEDRLRRLAAEIAAALERTSIGAQARPRARTPRQLEATRRYNHIIGESAAMAGVYALLRKAAETSATVLLRGESGTGKELFARAIHWNSNRRTGPFVKLDCTTLPATLIENELFGHERGAYTGADSRAAGKCEQADGGTLFIDELGELPIAVQGKLLRFIQDREFERIGGNRTITSDVRVVAATHRDLEAMVGRGGFREDLYYRVKVLQIHLPALRERGPDEICTLAAHFLEQAARRYDKPPLKLTEAARARLCAHRWPGNIRELENCMESAAVLCEGDQVLPEHLALPPAAADVRPSGGAPAAAFDARPLAEVERAHVLAVLDAVGGNRSQAARILQIGRNTLVRKLAAWGVSAP